MTVLYEIARILNQSAGQEAALRAALAKTVEVLHLQGGWIWLVEANQRSVYLAASHQLPTALRQHPEKLSGWCWCIEAYLRDKQTEPGNVSEVACTRLKALADIPGSFHFHATVPITTHGQKIGILNLLHAEQRAFTTEELELLQTVSELIGITVTRTRAMLVVTQEKDDSEQKILRQFVQPQLVQLQAQLKDPNVSREQLQQQLAQLQTQLTQLQQEQQAVQAASTSITPLLRYPESPLTPREAEVLGLVAQGLTNVQIAEQLFVTERTVKFHLSAILGKLNARTRTQAVAVARHRGML